MEIFLIILIMLLIVGISNVLNHLLPFIPVPLIQIVLGVLITVSPQKLNVPLNPELFFVLFIAPILFNDAKNVSRKALWSLRKQILLLALGLVFLTVFVVGYLVHWIIPAIPLSAAFALAAILSPTDIVAVNAMSSRVKIPKNIMHLLEGEGLMNDASGLVAFNFAVAATVTGAFSMWDAEISFLQIAIGGFVGGAILAFLIIRMRIFIRRMGMEDVTFHMLIQILTPFIIYLVIEHLHFSGILAVVAAGIVHGVQRDHEESPNISLQVVSKSTWTVLVYVLNGLVFVLLGLQIPDILNQIFEDPRFNNMKVIGYTLIISIALFALRFLWLYLVERFKKTESSRFGFKNMAIATVSGVRGSVTLAGAFSIPFVLADGRVFPQRSLIIFIAAGVILITLIAASILLPVLAKSKEEKEESAGEIMEKRAMICSYEAAIQTTYENINEENCEIAMVVIAAYHQEIQQIKAKQEGYNEAAAKKMEIELRMKALKAEADYVARLIEKKSIDKETAYRVQAHIRKIEVAVSNRFQYKILMVSALIIRIFYKISRIFVRNKEEFQRKEKEHRKKIEKVRKELSQKAIQAIKSSVTTENKEISYLIIGEYSKMISGIKSRKSKEYSMAFARQERELKEKAFQSERDEIQKLYENGKITKSITQKIRQQINIRESYFMEAEGLDF